MEFVWIPAGEFMMGSKMAYAECDERCLTWVRISEGYWLGKYEVTQGQWAEVMGGNPSLLSSCGADCPVEQVSWYEVQAFVRRLNAREGTAKYRLPTEAEWEYAARAGTLGDRYGALHRIAWHVYNSGDRAHPVGLKAPNGWGLYDMLGNVWEWVQDRYGDYPGGSVTDPAGSATGYSRVFRGGSASWDARYCRSAFRFRNSPDFRSGNIGFRLLRIQ